MPILSDGCNTSDLVIFYKSTTVVEAVKSEMSVPTLRFIVFLHIQQLHKISLRSSLSASSVEYPHRHSLDEQ